MKLLLDQNLSPQLVYRLADLFPGSLHVSTAGLGSADDKDVWHYAEAEGFTIVTKDADFNDLAVILASPPQVIWLRLGNCTTKQVETHLRANVEIIEAFSLNPDAGVLELS